VRNFTVALLKLGDVDVALHAPATAQPSFEQALRLRRTLLARSPADPSLQRDVAVVLGRVASAAFNLRDYQAGLAPMTEAIAFYEGLVAQNGASEESRRELAVNLYDLAGAEISLRRFTEARGHLDRGVALLRSVNFQSPLSGPHQELFQSLRRAGLVALELRDVAAAGKLHGEACTLMKAVPDDALGADNGGVLFFDLVQIAEAHLQLYPGDQQIGRQCGIEAIRRIELFRARNEKVWEDKEVQDTLGKLRRYLQATKPR